MLSDTFAQLHDSFNAALFYLVNPDERLAHCQGMHMTFHAYIALRHSSATNTVFLKRHIK